MKRRVVLAALVLFIAHTIAVELGAQSQGKLPIFGQGYAISGGTVTPKAAATLGGGFAVGAGDYLMAGIEYTHTHLSNYALGVGYDLKGAISYPVSRSQLEEVDFFGELDLRGKAEHGRLAPTLRFGIARGLSRFVTPQDPSAYLYSLPVPQTAAYQKSNWMPDIGVGLRIPVADGVGIHPEIRMLDSIANGMGLSYPSSRFEQQDKGDLAVRITVSIYFLHHTHS